MHFTIVLLSIHVCVLLSSDNEKETHYEVLGVPFTATREDISKAHKLIALKYHPDRPQYKTLTEAEKAEAPIILAKIGKAKEVLTNPIEKMFYDLDHITYPQEPPAEGLRWSKVMKLWMKNARDDEDDDVVDYYYYVEPFGMVHIYRWYPYRTKGLVERFIFYQTDSNGNESVMETPYKNGPAGAIRRLGKVYDDGSARNAFLDPVIWKENNKSVAFMYYKYSTQNGKFVYECSRHINDAAGKGSYVPFNTELPAQRPETNPKPAEMEQKSEAEKLVETAIAASGESLPAINEKLKQESKRTGKTSYVIKREQIAIRRAEFLQMVAEGEIFYDDAKCRYEIPRDDLAKIGDPKKFSKKKSPVFSEQVYTEKRETVTQYTRSRDGSRGKSNQYKLITIKQYDVKVESLSKGKVSENVEQGDGKIHFMDQLADFLGFSAPQKSSALKVSYSSRNSRDRGSGNHSSRSRHHRRRHHGDRS